MDINGLPSQAQTLIPIAHCAHFVVVTDMMDDGFTWPVRRCEGIWLVHMFPIR